ncbi:hypothetical protein [Caballeronia sp. SBC2]|uniref:hypothetical protein n=1 Tax=Caballeronia sp. SBC2 TaxID=2705547 RepID=UPI0013E1006C|nr:hypothetical protein [Caballeronia sp. SBC2]QIE29615.1 hypothetical protein SBC2_76910 [Caballeronia sp. SBC2]
MPALDSASGPMIELTDEEVMSETAHRIAHPHILQRPDRVELAILTALADTYGAQILTHAELGYALRLVARYGGVAFAQRILWGESAADRQLAVMLTPARAAFAPIARAFPAAFLAEAKAAIAANCPPLPRPPAAPSTTPGSDRE